MVEVEPGINIDDLNKELKKHNLEFIVPLETNITIQEAINENMFPAISSQGNMKESVEDLTMITGNNKIIKTGNQIGDEFGYGYSLKDLMIGSKNSLGFITKATLNLHPFLKYGLFAHSSISISSN